MIEKLNVAYIQVESDSNAKLELANKINELVDAVNESQKHEEQHLDLLTQLNEMRLHQTKEPTDPYAEQRKWIGKICKFWNWDTGLAHYSKFITIKDINDGEMSNCPFRADDGGWYMYCEPVKPDDDIIYKGE